MRENKAWMDICESMTGLCPVVIASPPAYPFLGEKAMETALAESMELATLGFRLMGIHQTEDEKSRGATLLRNHRGFDGKEGRVVPAILAKLEGGEELTRADRAQIMESAVVHHKQILRNLRWFAMAQDPVLAGWATRFSIPVPEWIEMVSPDSAGIRTRKEKEGTKKKTSPILGDEVQGMWKVVETLEEAKDLRDALLAQHKSAGDQALIRLSYFEWKEANG